MRTVVVLIESSRAYGRGLLRGVARYQRESGHWSIYVRPHGLGDPPPTWLRRWQGDGVLARIGDRRMATAVRATGLPAVDLRGMLRNLGIPFLGVDNRAVAELAAEHLLQCGLRHFAFCGVPRGAQWYLDDRCDHFVARLARAGQGVEVFPAGNARRADTWEQDQRRLADWITGLPRPIGIMACHDDRGLQVLDACRRAGAAVPDEVAVIGVDDDEVLCIMSTPPLTSIDLNPERIGYEAAVLLDRMMDGAAPPAKPSWLPPRGVVARQSTDILTVDDTEVASALRFIREHACEGLRVHEVLKRVSLSQSVLERRFHKLLGRSPKAEIARVQVECAKRLLSETTLSLEAVSRKAGFHTASYLSDVFVRKVGLTPGAFRKRMGR